MCPISSGAEPIDGGTIYIAYKIPFNRKIIAKSSAQIRICFDRLKKSLKLCVCPTGFIFF